MIPREKIIIIIKKPKSNNLNDAQIREKGKKKKRKKKIKSPKVENVLTVSQLSFP